MSTEAPSWLTGQVQAGHSFSVMKVSDLGPASVDGIVSPSQIESESVMSPADNFNVKGHGVNANAYGPASDQAGLVATNQTVQDTTFSFPPYEPPSKYPSADIVNVAAATSSSGMALSNPGWQSHAFYDQQGPSGPSGYALHHTQAYNDFQPDHALDHTNFGSSIGPVPPHGHNYTHPDSSLPSGQYYRDDGPSALVVIPGTPALVFNIPLHLANALHTYFPISEA